LCTGAEVTGRPTDGGDSEAIRRRSFNTWRPSWARRRTRGCSQACGRTRSGRGTSIRRAAGRRPSRGRVRISIPRSPPYGQHLAFRTKSEHQGLMPGLGHDSARAALIYQHATSEADQEIAAGSERLVDGERSRSCSANAAHHADLRGALPVAGALYEGAGFFHVPRRRPSQLHRAAPELRRARGSCRASLDLARRAPASRSSSRCPCLPAFFTHIRRPVAVGALVALALGVLVG